MINIYQYKTGAEIGCRVGATTGYILRNCPSIQMLYAVDIWDVVPESVQTSYWLSVYRNTSVGGFRSMKRKFERNTMGFKKNTTVLQGLSWKMAQNVADRSLDFVFIDADHAYESVVKDITAWTPKLKEDGLLCGHDYNLEGVNRAINELVPDWQATGIDHVWYSGNNVQNA